MMKRRVSRTARMALWMGAALAGMAMVHGAACYANGLADREGPGLIAGIVEKMVDPSKMGERLAGAVVTVEKEVWEEKGDGGASLQAMPELTTKTAEDGSYVVRNIESGSYRLTVSAEGLRAAQNYTWVDAGHSVALDFTLVPDYEEGVGTVKGTVIAGEGSEKAGQPLAGAQVEARPPASLQGPNFSTLTDSQGHFSLNVPAGFEEITAWADGYESLVKPVKVSANDVVELNFVPAVQKDYEGD